MWGSWGYYRAAGLVLVLSCFSRVRLFATVWTVAHQAPLSMGFFRQEHWSGMSCPLPGDFPHSGIEPGSLTLQADCSVSHWVAAQLLSWSLLLPSLLCRRCWSQHCFLKNILHLKLPLRLCFPDITAYNIALWGSCVGWMTWWYMLKNLEQCLIRTYVNTGYKNEHPTTVPILLFPCWDKTQLFIQLLLSYYDVLSFVLSTEDAKEN